MEIEKIDMDYENDGPSEAEEEEYMSDEEFLKFQDWWIETGGPDEDSPQETFTNQCSEKYCEKCVNPSCLNRLPDVRKEA